MHCGRGGQALTIPAVRAAVVGHVEWVEFVRGDHVPAAGEIVHATGGFEEPRGRRGSGGHAAGADGGKRHADHRAGG